MAKTHIAAVDSKSNLLICTFPEFKIIRQQEKLEIRKDYKEKVLDEKDIAEVEIYTHVSQLKDNLWCIGGFEKSEDRDPENYFKRFYLIQGDIIAKPVSHFPKLGFDNFLGYLSEGNKDKLHYFKVEYIPKR